MLNLNLVIRLATVAYSMLNLFLRLEAYRYKVIGIKNILINEKHFDHSDKNEKKIDLLINLFSSVRLFVGEMQTCRVT